MNHQRLMPAAVFPDIFKTKASRQIEIELHGGKLPGAADSVDQFDIDFRAIKRGLAHHALERNVHAFERRGERPRGAFPIFAGSREDWERATRALSSTLERMHVPFKRMVGEAAFYGPKIDVKLIDAIGRPWQLTTVQFDFNLPGRFGLEYVGEDGGRHQPLMVHRALWGSVERFFGILIEHYAGAFPLWLAPVQVAVLPVSNKFSD